MLGDPEDPLLGGLEDLRHLELAGVGVSKSLPRGRDQLAKRGLLADDSSVARRVGRRRHTLREMHEVVETTDLVEQPLIHQHLVDLDDVDARGAVVATHHEIEDDRVRWPVEVVPVLDDADDVRHHRRIEEHGAEQRDLGFDRMRRDGVRQPRKLLRAQGFRAGPASAVRRTTLSTTWDVIHG